VNLRNIERIEHAIVGSHEMPGEHVGLVNVTPKFEEDGETRRGTLVEMSVATVEDEAEYVGVKVDNYIDNGVIENVYEKVTGVEKPHMGYLYFDNEGKQQDWCGTGFYKAMGDEPGWGAFRPAFPYNSPSVLESGAWAIGGANILDTLRQKIGKSAETPVLAESLYATTYVRFNRLLLDSLRQQIKYRRAQPTPLSQILLIDPNMSEVMLTELDLGLKYNTFTDSHITSDKNWLAKLNNQATLSTKDGVADQFELERQRIQQAHSQAYEQCNTMHDSIYVPSGFRIGAGRSWPYMDVGDYDKEVKALRAGNFGSVVNELDRELKELEYKRREFVTPYLLVLSALSLNNDPIIYS